MKYWLMLPAPVRIGGAALLAALACLVVFRLVRQTFADQRVVPVVEQDGRIQDAFPHGEPLN